ncbi:hypothetical protein AGLY_000339 [Aphis glycines]|uniref:Uncharacterized protein n=1 Tax=Aphis glycines TaxID=307491 RepID=A0A6G0U768_APHGL|nr:hypothetical protein AGLY_000339 [Aphis glycines]
MQVHIKVDAYVNRTSNIITYLMMNYASGRGRETAIRVASEVNNPELMSIFLLAKSLKITQAHRKSMMCTYIYIRKDVFFMLLFYAIRKYNPSISLVLNLNEFHSCLAVLPSWNFTGGDTTFYTCNKIIENKIIELSVDMRMIKEYCLICQKQKFILKTVFILVREIIIKVLTLLLLSENSSKLSTLEPIMHILYKYKFIKHSPFAIRIIFQKSLSFNIDKKMSILNHVKILLGYFDNKEKIIMQC